METSLHHTSRGMPSSPLSAILIEDSQTIRDTLSPALEEMADTRVIAWATTAAEAREVLIEWKGKWQLIIVDLFLAAGSGLDVLAEVNSRNSDQYAFVLSNYATAEMRRRCKGMGADEVFDKSTEIDAFIDQCIAIERTNSAHSQSPIV